MATTSASILRPTLLDRYVARRFVSNFIVLFCLLFVFGVSVDIIVQAERFLDAAALAVEEGRSWNRITGAIAILVDFHGPRVFQFYQYMLGLVAIGSMGFTFAQMHRARELVALMAAGVSLRRLAAVVLVVAVGLNMLQAVNQELVLPMLAPRLVREHTDLMREGTQRFPIPLTRDGARQLLQARAFDPATGTIEGLLVIERDEKGAAVRRVTAERADFDPKRRAWILEQGREIRRTGTPTADATPDTTFMQPVESVPSLLNPQALVVKRFRLYAQMLGLDQVRMLREIGGTDDATVTRLTLARVAGPLSNLLVLAVAMPFFLLREPRSLLVQSVRASAVAIPAMLGALVFLTVPFETLPAAVAVALPVALLVPAATWRIAYLRT